MTAHFKIKISSASDGQSNMKKYLMLLIMVISLINQANAQSTERIILDVGNTRHEFGDYRGAIEAFTLALEVNPQFALAYNNRGISKAMMGNDEGAIEDFTRSLEINENYEPAFLNRAASKYNTGNYYGAIEDYGKVIEMDPENPIAWYGRGISHLQIKYFIGACEDFNTALELGYYLVEDLIEEHCR